MSTLRKCHKSQITNHKSQSQSQSQSHSPITFLLQPFLPQIIKRMTSFGKFCKLIDFPTWYIYNGFGISREREAVLIVCANSNKCLIEVLKFLFQILRKGVWIFIIVESLWIEFSCLLPKSGEIRRRLPNMRSRHMTSASVWRRKTNRSRFLNGQNGRLGHPIRNDPFNVLEGRGFLSWLTWVCQSQREFQNLVYQGKNTYN